MASFVRVALLLATTLLPTITWCAPRDAYAVMQIDTEANDETWEQRMGQELQSIVEGARLGSGVGVKMLPAKKSSELLDEEQTNVQTTWQITSDPKATTAEDKPRPPVMEGAINNLRGVLDRIEGERVNAVAVGEAQASSYASKKALLQSLMAGPQQAVLTRLEDRKLCDKHVQALGDLMAIVSRSLSRVQELVLVREQQSERYTQTNNAAKALAEKNKAALIKVIDLIGEEVLEEQKHNGGYHFDPVTLRTQQPQDILSHVQSLASSLGAIMQKKIDHQTAALADITAAFNCPVCVQKSKVLSDVAQQLATKSENAKKECLQMAEQHRELDEADREKVIALKKDLEDLETAERLHKEAEANLQAQRDQAKLTAEKMVGFYQSVGKN